MPVDDGGFAAWFAELPGFVGTIEHVLTVDERAAVERFLGRRHRPADPSELPLCHNDLGAEHVLVDPTTLTMTGIIDWSDAARADPAAELGRLLRDLGADHLDAVVDGLRRRSSGGRWSSGPGATPAASCSKTSPTRSAAAPT